MAPKLYMALFSPPVRATLLAAKAIGVELERKEMDMMNGEHLTPEYLKLNPQHTIPTLDDDGFIIWDSHAIMSYLVNKYAQGNSLYPEDPQQRAVIDQRLHFDSGVLFPILIAMAKPIQRKLTKTVPQEKIDTANEALGFLEKFLEGEEWVAGKNITLADLSLVATVTSMDMIVPIENYPNIVAWVQRCEELPYYSENKEGLEKLKAYFSELMAS